MKANCTHENTNHIPASDPKNKSGKTVDICLSCGLILKTYPESAA